VAGLTVNGITLFAAITGTITSAIVTSRSRDVAPSPAGRLRELVALRDDGLVTDDEFALKRSLLIAEL
jgi:hypothetical protein